MTNTVEHKHTVSVIVLNCNGAEHLPACLESLYVQNYPALEIIVADNGSTDNSKEVSARYAGVLFIDLGGNLGFARGNNAGAHKASGDFLFFVNNDMRFPPDLICTLVGVITQDDSLFALDVRQMSWDGERVVHAAVRFKEGRIRGGICPFIDVVQVNVRDCVPVPWANGANFFCRRDMFVALGGFDEAFFIDYEDVDLGWRAWLRGWRTLYVPWAFCFHKVAAFYKASGGRGDGEVWGRNYRRSLSGERNKVRFVMKTMGFKTNRWMMIRNHLLAIHNLTRGHVRTAFVLLCAWWVNILRLRDNLKERRAILASAQCSSQELIQRFYVGKSEGF